MSSLNPFATPKPIDKARDQLYKAEMGLLDALAAKEHFVAECTAMEATIARLTQYVKANDELA